MSHNTVLELLADVDCVYRDQLKASRLGPQEVASPCWFMLFPAVYRR